MALLPIKNERIAIKSLEILAPLFKSSGKYGHYGNFFRITSKLKKLKPHYRSTRWREVSPGRKRRPSQRWASAL